jgi:hypothetical protein
MNGELRLTYSQTAHYSRFSMTCDGDANTSPNIDHSRMLFVGRSRGLRSGLRKGLEPRSKSRRTGNSGGITQFKNRLAAFLPASTPAHLASDKSLPASRLAQLSVLRSPIPDYAPAPLFAVVVYLTTGWYWGCHLDRGFEQRWRITKPGVVVSFGDATVLATTITNPAGAAALGGERPERWRAGPLLSVNSLTQQAT